MLVASSRLLIETQGSQLHERQTRWVGGTLTDNELYKLLLVAQCNELSRVMPFLFERIDDETELLLPENLLRTDSIVAKLVGSVPEEDWQEIEVIGWLYQFYISEKKDQVIGKVVKSEDIPAATQLFTPNWIVQYLVQNSLGRLWLMANPQSTLAKAWPYYITPAEQTPEAQAQLDALIQTRVREDGDTLNPESITVLDPACGSGHILVVAYDVLKAIYLERGYQPRSIPRLILEKNLYGLDIDDRAAQLAAFALLMKAREDDRRLFNDPPTLNVLSLQASTGLDVDEVTSHLAPFGVQRALVSALLENFQHAKSFGSLIQMPATLNENLQPLVARLQQAINGGDLYARQAAADLMRLVGQGATLGMQFDAVVANPPYMSGSFGVLHSYLKRNYEDTRSDLFACFMDRGEAFAKQSGVCAMITLQSWMYSSSYEKLRLKMLAGNTISSLVHIGYNSFPTLNSKIAIACMYAAYKTRIRGFVSKFIDLNSAPKSADKRIVFQSRSDDEEYTWKQEDFERIPGAPLSYSISRNGLHAFDGPKLSEVGDTRRGLQTGSKDRYIRCWHECNIADVELSAESRRSGAERSKKWFLFNNGGEFRRWYGNVDLVVLWERDGEALKKFPGSIIPSEHLYFESAICWSRLTYNFGFRLHPAGVIPGDLSPCFYPSSDAQLALAYMNSSVAEYFINAINPSITKAVGDVAKIPSPQFSARVRQAASEIAGELMTIAQSDWDSVEVSIGFRAPNFLLDTVRASLIGEGYFRQVERYRRITSNAKRLEQSINEIFATELKLVGSVECSVPVDRIALHANSAFRYSNIEGASERSDVERRDFAVATTSYAIGCMMGRYSLDEPGLIYAHAGNVGFDPSRYEKKFPADADGIVPLTEAPWFIDDAASRVREFLRAVWGAETMVENIAWLGESLGTKGNEPSDVTIRRYLADKFFKDHLQTYKKRPIYWLFSSGKQGAFQALVYLHRYNEGTLARMRAEYVVPLIAKVVSRLDMLDKDVAAASSAAARIKLQKQIESLRKKQVELLAYDEKLRHYADMRITLDLDDGVKVNYAKFGDLVAESKSITGGSDE